jgi:hypothetical protein
MKRKIMNSVLAFGAIAMLSLFGSCSNDESGSEAVAGKTKTVKVRISVPSTYSEAASAQGLTPALENEDVYLFFVGGGIVRKVETASTTVLQAEGKTVTDISELATRLVIIANSVATPLSADLSAIAEGDFETKLNEAMFIQDAQPADPAGYVSLYGLADLNGVSSDENSPPLEVDLVPAISRIEIGEVKAKAAGGDVSIPLSGFKLAGIYINNTYARLGTDYVTSSGEYILNYAKNDPKWNTYPASFCDVFDIGAISAAASFTPTNSSHFWSYYVFPAKAGTTIEIEGNQVEQTAVPHIVLKIEGAQSAGFEPGSWYVTITQLEVENKGIITELERGKVYRIETIEIAGENMATSPEPGGNDGVSQLVVKATVKGWEVETTTPKVPGV